MLSYVGNVVKSINPSLVAHPPKSLEDVCYLGPNGETETNYLIYCKDLPDGMPAMVGSWYLNPERHAIEFVVFVAASLMIISVILPSLSRYPQGKVDQLSPPMAIKVTTFITYMCQLYYKLNGYPGKMLFMGMPCNVLWTMWFILCFWPKLSAQTMFVMYQLIVPYSSLAIVAVATPDTSGKYSKFATSYSTRILNNIDITPFLDLVMWMEVPFFFFMHWALIVFPIYLIKIQHISVLPLENATDGTVSNFMKIWLLACAYFGLFYFGVGTPLSLLTGLNLNYMLHPPPNPGDIVGGSNFRLQSTLACAAIFFFIQVLATVFEISVGRGIKKGSNRKSKAV